MSNTSIRWFAITKEDLLDLLLGEHAPQGIGVSTLPADDVRFGKIAIGYHAASRERSYVHPSLIVVGDQAISETMSWLRVYAEEASPLSQFTRVVQASDWMTFTRGGGSIGFDGIRLDRWASVAVGETLAQSGGDADLLTMPHSRAGASLTMPIARTTLLFGEGDATQICIDRLHTLETDSRFGKHSISVDQLIPIWKIISSGGAKNSSVIEAAALVLAAGTRIFHDAPDHSILATTHQLLGNPGLSSDSVEERVLAFHNLSVEVNRLGESSNMAGMGPTLAAAAFLVGRSTSHMFLLKRFSRVAPDAIAWFGVIAALAGSRTWDAAWLRAVKGAERLLRPEFDWLDVPGADIGWAEFSWLASTFNGIEQIASLPKMLPRTLGIEIVPGATLQVRIGSDPIARPDSRQDNLGNDRERALENALAQFLLVAQRFRGLVDRNAPTAQSQQSLPLEGEQPTYSRSNRTTKQRRGPAER
jgi:hypothetical protein